MSIEVNLDSVPKILREMADEVAKDLTEIVREEVLKGVDMAKEKAEALGLVGVNSPHYTDSFRYEQTPKGGRVVNDAPYADALEYGSKPYQVPMGVVRKIAEWAEGKFGMRPYEAFSVALSVKEKIEQFGLEPNYVMGDTLAEIEIEIRARYQQYERLHKAERSPAAIRLRTRYGNKGKRPSIKV